MDFASVLKDSWKITWRKKSLWWLGFFAILTEAGSGSPTFYQLPAIPTSEDKAKAAASGMLSDLSATFSDPALITVSIITLIALLLIVLYISYSAKAGLILGADKYDKEKIDDKPIAKKLYLEGNGFAWKIFLFNLILAVIALFVIMLLVTPAVPLIMAFEEIAAIFMFIGLIIIACAVLIVFSIALTIVKQLGERMIVLDGKSVTHAFSGSIKMMMTNIGEILLTWLVSVAVGIGFSVGSFLGFFVAGLLYFVTSAVFYLLLKTPGLVFFGTTSGLLIVILVCAVLGAFSTFSSTYWTLSYKRLKKN